jgi:pimeloyl-ACP methyl ester carboxylesterase
LSKFTTLADTSKFADVGNVPGISDDGHVIAFVASKTVAGKTSAGLYVATDLAGGTFTTPLLVAGSSGNGILEPGETFDDLDGDGKFSPEIGEMDDGPFANLDLVAAVAVERSAGNICRIVFTAETPRFGGKGEEWRRSLLQARIDVGDRPNPLKSFGVLATIGEPVGDAANGLVTAEATDFSIHDPLNTLGDAVFWVKSGANSAIVKASSYNTALEILDHRHFYSKTAPAAGTYRRLSAPGAEMRGLAADGVSTLLIRAVAQDQPGQVEISISALEDDSQSQADVGSARDALARDQLVNGKSVSLTEDPDAKGTYRAFVLLQAPMDFTRPDKAHAARDAGLGFNNPRVLKLRARFFPTAGGEWTIERKLELHRPPVVLLHGLHDKKESWNWALEDDPRFSVSVPSYEDWNGKAFTTIVERLPAYVQTALLPLRKKGIAATQFDAVGHSMGGLLLRLFASDTRIAGIDTKYRRSDNYLKGDLHKLVTLNTPHWGSQIAPISVNQDGSLTKNGMLYPFGNALAGAKDWLSWAPDCADKEPRDLVGGAVRDLRPDSPILIAMNLVRLEVPVHAIYGIYTHGQPDSPNGDANCKESAYAWVGKTAYACLIDFTPEKLFFGPSDYVVGENSQRAGLPEVATTRIEGAEGLHWPTISQYPTGPSMQAATNLLNASVFSERFNKGFPERKVSPLVPMVENCVTKDLRLIRDWTLSTLPFGGQSGVNSRGLIRPAATGAGETLQVRVPRPPGLIATNIVLQTSAGESIPVKADATATVTLPGDWGGNFSVVALAETDSGTNYLSVALDVWITPKTVLGPTGFQPAVATLTVDGGPIQPFLPGSVNGRPANLADPRFGTRYTSSRTNVVQIDADGRLRPVGPGRSIITAQLGAISVQSEITVVMATPVAKAVPYADWARNLPEGAQGPDDEPFADHISNRARHIFGIAPDEGANLANLPRVRMAELKGARAVELRFTTSPNARPDQAAVEYSTDLIQWAPVVAGQTPLNTVVETNVSTRRYVVPAADRSGFLRVRLRD